MMNMNPRNANVKFFQNGLPCFANHRRSRKSMLLLIMATTLSLFVYSYLKYSQGPIISSTTFSKDEFKKLKILSYAEEGSKLEPIESPHYLLIRNHCKIPRVPFAVKELNLDWNDIEAEKCTREDDVTQLDDISRRISFNETKFEYCCYRNISRPYEMKSDSYNLSTPCKPLFNNDIMHSEYFIVVCTYRNRRRKVFRVHATIPDRKHTIVEKIKYWNLRFPKNERPPSVLMLVLDSTSRAHGYRSLPKTMNLLKRLKFIDFKGHHVLGEPTIPNALPLLIGASSSEDVFKTKPWEYPWDNYPFIWKEFSKLNYITYNSEDVQSVGTFNYGGQTGFTFQPVDINLRPLLLAHEDKSQYTRSKEHCLGNETIVEFVLHHQLKFHRHFKEIPNFSLNWLTWPQHDRSILLPIVDDSLYNYFTELSTESKILENTVIIVFGDHGNWREPYAKTKIGTLERKLPLLLIRYPENMSQKYPMHLENLKNNAYTITSHHDIYQTLIHLTAIANGSKSVKSPQEFRHSLLEPIPKSRTCKDARIPFVYCACNDPILWDEYGETSSN